MSARERLPDNHLSSTAYPHLPPQQTAIHAKANGSETMSPREEVWKTWDRAWDKGLSDSERLEHLKQCTAPGFVYTNPDTKISDDLQGLVKYISQAIAAAGDSTRVDHIDWKDDDSQSVSHWKFVDVKAGGTSLEGWSHGKYDADGKLVSAESRY
jgi:hypothetical protein